MTRAEFAAKIKAKYPGYASIPDEDLVTKILAKHPTYQSQITEDSKKPLDLSGGPHASIGSRSHNAADEADDALPANVDPQGWYGMYKGAVQDPAEAGLGLMGEAGKYALPIEVGGAMAGAGSLAGAGKVAWNTGKTLTKAGIGAAAGHMIGGVPGEVIGGLLGSGLGTPGSLRGVMYNALRKPNPEIAETPGFIDQVLQNFKQKGKNLYSGGQLSDPAQPNTSYAPILDKFGIGSSKVSSPWAPADTADNAVLTAAKLKSLKPKPQEEVAADLYNSITPKGQKLAQIKEGLAAGLSQEEIKANLLNPKPAPLPEGILSPLHEQQTEVPRTSKPFEAAEPIDPKIQDLSSQVYQDQNPTLLPLAEDTGTTLGRPLPKPTKVAVPKKSIKSLSQNVASDIANKEVLGKNKPGPAGSSFDEQLQGLPAKIPMDTGATPEIPDFIRQISEQMAQKEQLLASMSAEPSLIITPEEASLPGSAGRRAVGGMNAPQKTAVAKVQGLSQRAQDLLAQIEDLRARTLTGSNAEAMSAKKEIARLEKLLTTVGGRQAEWSGVRDSRLKPE